MRRLAQKVCLLKLVATMAAINSILIAAGFIVGGIREDAAVDRIQDLRQSRIADVARADRFVCEENNRQDFIITAILRASVKTRELDAARPALTRKEKELVQRSFDELVQANCGDLPTKPFRR